jgi:uncharacterized LabA/DUF88 family protein
MLQPARNYAFIDGNNLHMAVRDLGWRIDHRKFRVFLRERYQVEKAYYFVGFVEYNASLYQRLQEAGFILIFKPTIRKNDGDVKGNVDAELVLQAMIDFRMYEQAVIVTGDGDFACLVRYLRERGKLRCLLAPNSRQYSGLLKKAAGNAIAFIDPLRTKLEFTEKKSTR